MSSLHPPRRPQPRIRRDWKHTRSSFRLDQLRERQAADAARLRRTRDAALAEAESAFPATPVASTFERAFRRRYLAYVQRRGSYVSPVEYTDTRGSEVGLRAVAFIAFLAAAAMLVRSLAWFSGAEIVDSVVTAGASVVLSAIVAALAGVVGWVVGLVVVYPAVALYQWQAIRMFADHNAYAEWVASVSAEPTPSSET